jgi:hypothetical protein
VPRTADLMGVAHVLCQRTQCWEYTVTFMLFNQACKAAGVRAYTVDLLAQTSSLPELGGLPSSAGLATWLRNELASLLTERGFSLEDLSSALVAIDVPVDGDGSIFGIRTTFVRNGRVIARALDPAGRVSAIDASAPLRGDVATVALRRQDLAATVASGRAEIRSQSSRVTNCTARSAPTNCWTFRLSRVRLPRWT